MSELSLYRKYRPQDFENFVGQEHVRTTILNAFKTDTLSHAYLFCGPRGTGKTTTARLIAKIVNCENLNVNEPCNNCEICKGISTGQLIDLIEIDAASNRGIDEIRELRDKINFLPTLAKKKVYIIDEVHMLTKEAFNALLKTLEEPPQHVLFILATTEAHKIPETIISRCQRFDFKRIPDQQIVERLKFVCTQENFSFEKESLTIIAERANGGLRDALTLLEQVVIDQKIETEKVKEIIGFTGDKTIAEIVDTLLKSDANAGLNIINEVYNRGFDLTQLNKDIIQHLRSLMLSELKKNAKVNSNILHWIEIFQQALVDSKISPIPQLALEIAFVKACNASVLINKSESITPSVQINSSSEPTPKKTEVQSETPIAQIKEEPITDTPTAQPEPNIKEIKLDHELELSLETVKSKWPNIAQNIKSPLTKKLLIGSIPTKINSTELIISTNTNFQSEKLSEPANKNEIQDVFIELFQKNIEISFIKSEEQIANITSENGNQNSKHESELVEDVLNIFGGDIVS